MAYIGKIPAAAALTADDITDGIITEAKMANDAIGLTELKAGTDGEIISWDASGNPVAIGAGTSGHFLKSQGAGSQPVFAAAGGGIVNKLQFEQDNASTTSSTSTSFVDNGTDTAFTPAATDSHVWVNYKFSGSIGGGPGQYKLVRTIGGSSTDITTIDISASSSITVNNWYEDSSHNTTNEITYKLQMKSTQGNAGHTIYMTADSVTWLIIETTE